MAILGGAKVVSKFPFQLNARSYGDGVIYEEGDIQVTACHNKHLGKSKPFRSFSFQIEAGSKAIVYSGDVKSIDDFAQLIDGCDLLLMETGHHKVAVGVIETVWYLPENTPFAIDAQMEVIGTLGALYIDCGNAGLTINDTQGVHKPDTFYWPKLLGKRSGVLQNELSYFAGCIREGRDPDAITPEQSREAVAAVCAAERSAHTGEVVKLCQR